MEESILVKNKEELNKKIESFSKDNCLIITDFDGTLTKFKTQDNRVAATFQLLSKCLPIDYEKKVNNLYLNYHKYEIDPKLEFHRKEEKMVEWYLTHIDLLVHYGLSKKNISDLGELYKDIFRDDFKEFFTAVKEELIPMVVMSAGVGDLINKMFKVNDYNYDDLFLISNSFDYDDKGKIKGIKGNLMHSCSKNGSFIKKMNHYDWIKDKDHVIVMGDNLRDVDMIKGLDFDTVIKVGFLDDHNKHLKDEYMENFDIVIPHEGSISYIAKFIESLN